MNRWPLLAVAPLLLVSVAHSQKAEPCAALASLAMPHATVVHAQLIAAGTFTEPDARPDDPDVRVYQKLPAFCSVQVKSAPTSDSDITIDIWMPAEKWNGKFRGVGNGGFAGQIDHSQMAWAIIKGYATAATDTGHTGQGIDAAWALNHPEKIIDFGYRGIHEMTLSAKAVIDAYYGKAPTRSYFAACSDGGREALMEAQRFPTDYDGILAGAPAYFWTNLVTSGTAKVHALALNSAGYIPPAKLPAISSAVLAACDASDGLKDGILNDPRTCHFKPETLQCNGPDSDSCLTSAQVATLKTIYAPTIDSKGKQVYPGAMPGGELGPGGWALWIFGKEPNKSLGSAFSFGYFANMVYDDPHWDPKSFNLDDALNAAVSKTAVPLNATDPNLKAFSSHGGKLILYHGWNDPAISPIGTVDYYQQVKQTNPDAQSFVRLFMAPGMQHCYGGPGPSSFGQFGWRAGSGPDDVDHDVYLALEQWVDHGIAPEQVTAAKIEIDEKTGPKITMTRPLCAYPKEAKYKGTGDTSDAANFVCSE